MASFKIDSSGFSLDNQPFHILSGAIHYFRVFPECWKDRLMKLKSCGFNTVETYVPWNLHEPKEGVFRFDGMLDLVRFIRLAESLGLKAIIRPSPYICAEWEFGGLPAWLLSYPDMHLRCSWKPFLEKVDAYYDILIPMLVPLLCTKGGPVLAMQIENEYGSYGGDKTYLEYLRAGMVLRGVDVPLFTSDGPSDLMLAGGTLPDVYKTVNFGSRADEAFEKLKEWQPDRPLMCMEFWNGWFDHWGAPHHTRDAADAADEFAKMLELGASVNFYMFHGGTNFGFLNGANHDKSYTPTVNSYDYDSPLNECGDATEKWYRTREVLARWVDVDLSYVPPASVKRAYGEVTMDRAVRLSKALPELSEAMESPCPLPMESLGQDYGFILYRTVLPPVAGEHTLKIREVHDRALIFINGSFEGVLERNDASMTRQVNLTGKADVLEILVENMGRINYGEFLSDRKGITESVRLDYQFLFGWTIRSLPMDDLSRISFGSVADAALPFKNGMKETGEDTVSVPAFLQGSFEVDEPADTFLDMAGWNKGVVWVNGFNLSRYWRKGPTKTLYVPAPLLKKGSNRITVFELHGMDRPAVLLTDSMDLG